MRLPAKGLSEDQIFGQLRDYRKADLKWRSGKVMGFVYHAGQAAEAIGKKAYMEFLTENGLDPTSFPSLVQMENDLVSMAANLVGGDETVVGNFTSGGTESILMAVKTARDWFQSKRPDIDTPEMLLPATAHPAFHKAGKYFNVKPVLIPVNDNTFKADVDATRRAISPDTILIVGSAPSYAHGVVDPIPELAGLARDNGIFFHTDACVGGFMLPYLKRLGERIPDFGFTVPGVTSLSMDLHKYAYAPKNASIVLYRDRSIRRKQIFACANWPGYTITNSVAQSSKSGGPMAAAWAVMNFMGDAGYLKIAESSMAATRKLANGIRKIEGLELLAEPEMFMFSVKSDSIDVFHIIDEMKERGWYIQPQLAFQNSPENFHISVTAANIDTIDDLLSALQQSVQAARNLEEGALVGELKDLLQNLKPGDITEDNIGDMMALAGVNGRNLPGKMADINQIMNRLSVEHRELLLTEFLNDLFTPDP